MNAPQRAEQQPRLLDVAATAQYLGGISTWTVRALISNADLCPIRLPACHRKGENGRRLLFDRRDLDEFIEKRKHA
jgi:hypothetical protein